MIQRIIGKLRSVFFKKNDGTSPQEETPLQNKPEAGLKKHRDIASRKRKPKELATSAEKKKIPWNLSKFEVPPTDGETRFHDLNLPAKIMHAISDLEYQYCTPIQAQILPKSLAGKDATGQAQTGTGKSAAFLITIFTKLIVNPIKGKRRPGTPRVLILVPTRELVLQVEKDARAIGKYTRSQPLAVFGGMGYDFQKKTLQKKIIDIVIATPGRLLDFKSKKIVDLSKIEIIVLDEADRMLDMGFIADIRRIIRSTPPKINRQTMFFSATLTSEVKRLASQWTQDPFSVEIEPETLAADSIKQIIYIVTMKEKFSLLYNLIKKLDCVLVFTNRRDQARDLEEKISSHGISCALLSGEVSQKNRLNVLENFRNGKIRVMVATDVAARGLHVEGISHVINYNMPHNPEHYVHRIGRTGRAGKTGISISFACEEDSFYIPDIEEFLGEKMQCEYPEDELVEPPPKPIKKTRKPKLNANKRRQQKPYKKRHSTGQKQSRPKSQHRKAAHPHRKNTQNK